MARGRHYSDLIKRRGFTGRDNNRISVQFNELAANYHPQQHDLYTMVHDMANPNWLYNRDNIGDARPVTNPNELQCHPSLSEMVMTGDYKQFIALVNRGWMKELYDRLLDNKIIQPNGEVSLIISIAAQSDELTFNGAFLGEHASKIGAIVNPPSKVNHSGEWLSNQSMDFYKGYTTGVDAEKYTQALIAYPEIRELLTSNLSFYREYLDGVTHFPLSINLLRQLEICSDNQLTFRRVCELLAKVYFAAICKPDRLKITANVTVDDTYISFSVAKDGVFTFEKNIKSETVSSLQGDMKKEILNPAAVGNNVFGRYMHSFMRSNTNKLLRQLGLNGLLDQSAMDATAMDCSESFTGYYMNLMAQPLNNLTTIKVNEAGNDIVCNVSNDYKKMAVMPLNIVILDNVVYSLSDSIDMNIFSSGEQSSVEIQSAEQINYFIEELFNTDNFGYGALERNNDSSDDFIGVQTSSFNRAMADEAYNEIVSNEEKVNNFCNRIINAYTQNGKGHEYIKGEEYVRDLTGVKSIMDKYVHNSLNFPEYMPDNKYMSCSSTDVLVGARACGYLQASSLIKGMSRQVVLSFDNVQLRPGTELHKLIYGDDVSHKEICTKALEISKALITDVLNSTCSRHGVMCALDKIDRHFNDLRELINSDVDIVEKYLDKEFLGEIADIAIVSHLLYLSEVARDMLMYHMSRILNVKHGKPLGVITSYESDGDLMDMRLSYYSFMGKRYIDVSPVEKDGAVNFSSTRTNLLTTGVFGDVLAKTACHGYKMYEAELNILDTMACEDYLNYGARSATEGLYYKSYFHPDVLNKVWLQLNGSSGDLRKKLHATMMQSISESIKTDGLINSRSVPQLNSITYIHLLLDEQAINLKHIPRRIGVEAAKMYSGMYLRKSEESVKARYKGFATGFRDRYVNIGADMPDYALINYIDQERLCSIARRFNIFETVLVSALIQLLSEISDLTMTVDKTEREAIIDNIFTGEFVNKVSVNTRCFSSLGEDRLTPKSQHKQKYVPTMNEFVFHVLSCDSYFK